jgi:hypothetical protein
MGVILVEGSDAKKARQNPAELVPMHEADFSGP